MTTPDLWHHPPGATDVDRDLDALLLQWMGSDDPARWAMAVRLMGRSALARWFAERGSQGLSPRDGECWRIAFGLPPGSVPYAVDVLPWFTPVDEEHAFLALVA